MNPKETSGITFYPSRVQDAPDLKIYNTPRVFMVSSPFITEEVVPFLESEGVSDFTFGGTYLSPHALVELAGRLCYLSFGGKRRSQEEHIRNLIKVGHGSVLEHVNFGFILTGVARTLTHELVRHRAGFAYSQLSQRYVDKVAYVMPWAIFSSGADCQNTWYHAIEMADSAYRSLLNDLERKFKDVENRTLRLKKSREAARAILPHCAETKIMVTANARAWRHFLSMRGSEHADVDIRRVAFLIYEHLVKAAPYLFDDFQSTNLDDGTISLSSSHPKV